RDGQDVCDRSGATRDRPCRAAARRARRHQGREGRGALPRDPRAAHLRGRDRGAEGRDRARGVEEPPGETCAGGGMMETAMIQSGHVDTFTRDNLPPRGEWPEFRFTLPELQYPERFNCVTAFVDKWVARGDGELIAIVTPYETWTYAQLAERINRIAN